MYRRAKKLCSALISRLGVKEGDRVATFAWNHYQHLELYYAIPGAGAICHTLNIRLSTDQLVYIINHAEDKILMIDDDFVLLIEKVKDKLTSVKAFIVMTDQKELPETSLSPVYSYEELIKELKIYNIRPENIIMEVDDCIICIKIYAIKNDNC